MNRERQIVLGCIVLVVILSAICLGCYVSVFWGELPTDPNYWIAFGSYVGGVFGPIFSLIGILVVYYSSKKQIDEMRLQIDEDKNRFMRELSISYMEKLSEKICTCLYKKVNYRHVLDKYFLFCKIKKDDIDTIVYNDDGTIDLFMKNGKIKEKFGSSLIDIINDIAMCCDFEERKKFISSVNNADIDAIINNCVVSIKYFNNYVNLAFKYGVNFSIISLQVDSVLSVCTVLRDFGCIDYGTYLGLKMIMSMPNKVIVDNDIYFINYLIEEYNVESGEDLLFSDVRCLGKYYYEGDGFLFLLHVPRLDQWLSRDPSGVWCKMSDLQCKERYGDVLGGDASPTP